MYNLTWVVIVYTIIIINTITTAFINRHRHISKYHSNNIVIHAVKISVSGYDVTPWKSDRVISEAKRLYGDNDIRFNIIINSATEKSYTGKFMNGERYNHKGEGVYVGGILINTLILYTNKLLMFCSYWWTAIILVEAQVCKVCSSY